MICLCVIVTVYPNADCSGSNVISLSRDTGTGCFSFGNKLKITSVKVAGTCPGFQS